MYNLELYVLPMVIKCLKVDTMYGINLSKTFLPELNNFARSELIGLPADDTLPDNQPQVYIESVRGIILQCGNASVLRALGIHL